MANYTTNGQLKGAFGEILTAELTPVVQIKFPYSINPEIITTVLTGSGTAVQEHSMAKLSTTANTNSSSAILSHEVAVYQPGQGILARFTSLFSPGKEGSAQEIGVGDDVDGYFVGYNGEDFGVLIRHGGVDNWTALPQIGDGSSGFRGQVDLTKGNVFQIQFQWLGFGPITFSMLNTDNMKYETIYRERYTNRNIEPSTLNPSFPICMLVKNTTNDTDIVMKSASAAIMLEGKSTQLHSRFGQSNTKTLTTETSILSVRSRATYQSKTNRGLVFPDFFSLSSDGTKNVLFNFWVDVTLGGTPAWTDVNTANSIMEYDTAGTTVTGGKLVFTLQLSKINSQFLSLGKIFKLHNFEALTITAQSTSSTDAGASISWQEYL